MERDDLQFYPSTPFMVEESWALFKNRNFVRVLDPEAGEGHLAKGRPKHNSYCGPVVPVDCIEIDVTRHPILREEGFDVVGVDFLQFDGAGALYSHIIMNPPYAMGEHHVLKAWGILYDGEIVAQLNADTIRNPYSKERELLVRLIAQYGEVKFFQGAYSGPDAVRKTDVDVALIWLKKESNFSKELLGDILDGLKTEGHIGLDAGFEEANELAIPGSFIENSVLAFDAAVKAMRQSVFAEARAAQFAARLGPTMEQLNSNEPVSTKERDSSLQWVQHTMHERYSKYKSSAWTGILRSTQVLSKLSSSAQKRIETEFETIKKLQFSVSNVYGFIGGLIANQGEIQIGMVLDVFDLITRYHADNLCWYMGWKSNSQHRTCGMRIKAKRFVLPNHKTESYQTSFRYETEQMFRDLDKVFSLLDGKSVPDVSLEFVARHGFKELQSGQRLQSRYFDIRHYPGIGTLHFFPRDQKLVDRLNLLVGRNRKWLPNEEENVSAAFWQQYTEAENFDKEIRAEVKKTVHNHWDDPFFRLTCRDGEEKAAAEQKLSLVIASVLEKHGIDPDALLEAPQQNMLPDLLTQAAA